MSMGLTKHKTTKQFGEVIKTLVIITGTIDGGDCKVHKIWSINIHHTNVENQVNTTIKIK